MVIHRVFDRLGWAIAGSLAIALIAVVAGVVSAGPLDPPGPPASTAGVLRPGMPIDHIPYTISAPGNYYLTGNLTMTTAGADGIDVGTIDDVTIDLGGFTLDGTGIGRNGISASSGSHVAIRNGIVKRWTLDGVAIEGGSISDVEADANGALGILADSAAVHGCRATSNGDAGLAANSSTIADCVLERNHIGASLSFSTLDHSTSVSNTSDGAAVYFGSIVRDSVFAYNGSNGINVISNGAIIQNNSVTYNGSVVSAAGIYVNGSRNRIDGNHVTDNTGWGILAESPGLDNTIVSNTAAGNSYKNYGYGAPTADGGPENLASSTSDPWANIASDGRP